MAKKRSKQNQKSLSVSIHYVPIPQADDKLSRAIDILLRAAARDSSQAEDSPDADKEKPPTRGTRQDAGDGEMSNENDATLSHE